MKSLFHIALKASVALAVGGAIAIVPARAPAADNLTTWDIDSGHSVVEFGVRHLTVSTVKGQFGKVSGELVLDETDPRKSTVSAKIDPATIDTREPKRDAHLRSPDFFDVAKYPTVTFKSTKIKSAGQGKLEVTGDLTIRDVTKPVTLAVEGPTPAVKDLKGFLVRGASLSGKINRKDWGLTWNKPLEAAGGVLVGDEVSLDIQVELHQRREVAPGTASGPAAKAPAAAHELAAAAAKP
jgi:polyisoprenoid-binding protein YceI